MTPRDVGLRSVRRSLARCEHINLLIGVARAPPYELWKKDASERR